MGVISNGTTLLDAGALDSGIPTGAMTLIKTLTASTSATLDFLNGASSVVFDDTYDAYVFKFYNIHPATNGADFTFQADTGTNTNYNIAMTTTYIRAAHGEDGSGDSLTYDTGRDQAQGTGFLQVISGIGNDADGNGNGTLHIFSPSSSTFVKNFIIRSCTSYEDSIGRDMFIAGYFNTTTALTRVRFKMSSGNIDSGIIKMYGIK
jgi:hypothetical protein